MSSHDQSFIYIFQSLELINCNIHILCFSTVSEPPMIVSSAFAHCSNETTKVRPNLPEEEIRVDMVVLGRKRSLTWQRGKIVDIVTKGKKMYVVCNVLAISL